VASFLGEEERENPSRERLGEEELEVRGEIQ
jgi:hypothetical protein